MEITTLRQLAVGDEFIHAKDKSKNPVKFKVTGNPTFNRAAGTSTRECRNLKTGLLVDKKCALEVKKLTPSAHSS